MLFHYSLLLASFSLLLAPVASYQIHQSCVDKEIATTVRDGMTSAFEMADSALRHLNQNPHDRDTTDLIRRLFLAKSGQDINNKDSMLKVRRIFGNIIKFYRTEIDTTASATGEDIIIYCDDSRYVSEGERDRLQRPLFRDALSNAEVVYRKQSCHALDVELVSLMVTDNPYKQVKVWNDHIKKHVFRNVAMPTAIMVCPWFIDWIKSKEYKLGNEVMRSNFGRKVVKKAEGNKWLRQIDALSLLDKVLLHEMTHGRMAYLAYLGQKEIEGTDDVEVPPVTFLGIPMPWPLFGAAYGWKKVRDLATRGATVVGVENWSPKAPDHNADSIALFGSAAKLLDHEHPRRVLDDGSIEPVV